MTEQFRPRGSLDERLIQYHERNAIAQWVLGEERVLEYFDWAKRLVTGTGSEMQHERQCMHEARKRVIHALNSRDKLEDE